MGNKVYYVNPINFINFVHCETKETKKLRQNPVKWGCDSFK